MTNFLVKLLVKDCSDTQNPAVRERYGQAAGSVGIGTNLLLFCIKLFAGLFANSISIMADAINNLSDAGSSIVTVVGFKLAGRPADKEHPFGHARMEYISGLVISFIIVLLGVELFKSSLNKILNPTDVAFSYLVVVILIISILLKIWQGLFYRTIAKRINSTTLKATSTDSFNDVISTSGVLVSTIISRLTGFNLDGYMGVLVAVIIVISGVKLVGETINPLLGLAPEKDLVDSVTKKILSYDGICGMHDLNIHNYGQNRCFASVHVEVSANQDIMLSHDIVDNIERDFERDCGIHMVIHLDPIITDDKQISELKELVSQKLKEIDEKIQFHDFRVVFGATHTNIIFDVCIGFDFKYSDLELKGIIERKIKEIDDSYFAVVVIDHSPY